MLNISNMNSFLALSRFAEAFVFLFVCFGQLSKRPHLRKGKTYKIIRLHKLNCKQQKAKKKGQTNWLLSNPTEKNHHQNHQHQSQQQHCLYG